jgi:CHAT domain-containing protein
MMNLGVVYRNLGDPVRAVDSFEQAIETYERLGDKSALSTAFVNLGLARHLNLADPVGAEEAYGRALQLARDIGDLSEEIRDLYYLGRLLLDLGRADEAKAVYERCLETSQTSGSSEGRRVALEGLAGVARSRNELPRALELLEQAIEEIERVRASLSEDPLRADYFGEKRSVYTAAVEVLADLERIEPGAGHAERGLSLVQNAKARGLLDALGPDPERGTPREAAALARVVGGDWLLEYFAGDTQLLVWVVHDGRIELTALGDPEPVLAEVEAIHRALARGDEPSAESLQLLSEVLLHELDLSPADDDHVRIAPDRRLHYLPFELLTPRGGEGRPLVERTTVSYLPSGSALDWLRRESGPRACGFVGFGGATLPDPDVEEPTPAGMLVSRFGLRPLPAAGEELASVGRWLPGESSVHVEDRATERALAAVVAQGARVVHLASHAVIDERPRRGAAILLTPRDRDDGLLHPDEILGLDYPVDLTVLAACRTALSAEADGDALATLTGAFLAAGSSAVVATLWDVGDAETRAFMEQFYYQLHRGLAPARALRETKRTLRRDPTWSRSNLWSAYVLVGDAAPVAARPFLRRWAPMLGAVGVLALVGLLVNRRIRRF